MNDRNKIVCFFCFFLNKIIIKEDIIILLYPMVFESVQYGCSGNSGIIRNLATDMR